jgi:hypothetical protein
MGTQQEKHKQRIYKGGGAGMILNANALNIPLVDGCVQCVVTSPPY